MISLVMDGMQNWTSSFIHVLTKFSKRASSSDCVVTGPSGGSDVTSNEVFMCSSLILIAIGALEEGLAG